MPWAASRADLHAAMPTLRKKCSLPAANSSAYARRLPSQLPIDSSDAWPARALISSALAGAVAIVALVAHVQRLRDQRAHVDPVRSRAQRLAQRGAEHPPTSSRADRARPGPKPAVAQHAAQALVQVAVRAVARLRDSRCTSTGIDDVVTPGHRADRAVVVARLETHVPPRRRLAAPRRSPGLRAGGAAWRRRRSGAGALGPNRSVGRRAARCRVSGPG